MTYTQLRTQHCPPVDAILSGNDYVSEFDCDMRRWLTESCQKGLPPIEDRAAGQSLAGRYTVGIELCTPTSKFSFLLLARLAHHLLAIAFAVQILTCLPMVLELFLSG